MLGTLRQLSLERLLASKPSRQRDLVVAMIVERLLHPGSKLATTRLWRHSTLAQQLGESESQALQNEPLNSLHPPPLQNR